MTEVTLGELRELLIDINRHALKVELISEAMMLCINKQSWIDIDPIVKQFRLLEIDIEELEELLRGEE